MHYDHLNRLLSLDLDRMWRKALVGCAELKHDSRILDVCTGTGDIAIEFAKKGAGEIIGIDLSEKMLLIGRRKIERMGLDRKIKLQRGDCLALPFKDNTFDIVSIGFGLRNLPDRKRGIAEMVRVLKEGGQLLMLDFSLPENKLFSGIYRFYLERFVPLVGGVVSGSRSAYEYLSSSILNFSRQEEVIEMMRDSGLESPRFKVLTWGITSIYWGKKFSTS
jgi:demethylmenaquinone methyltransferase/2-methoxy-6-polyprenyl-1,4-benzoquinol methylase